MDGSQSERRDRQTDEQRELLVLVYAYCIEFWLATKFKTIIGLECSSS